MEMTPTRDPAARFTITTRFGTRGSPRTVEIAIGREYVVDPLNPRKRKHRGRRCVITELADQFMPDVATVRFTDGLRGHWGKVDIGDLVPVTSSP